MSQSTQPLCAEAFRWGSPSAGLPSIWSILMGRRRPLDPRRASSIIQRRVRGASTDRPRLQRRGPPRSPPRPDVHRRRVIARGRGRKPREPPRECAARRTHPGTRVSGLHSPAVSRESPFCCLERRAGANGLRFENASALKTARATSLCSVANCFHISGGRKSVSCDFRRDFG